MNWFQSEAYARVVLIACAARGVALRVVDQLRELGSQARGQLRRQAVQRPVKREHRLGVDGLDQVVIRHPARGL